MGADVGRADLHIHTTASDGTLTPSEVVQQAAARGLKAIAITDHDTIGGIAGALQAAVANGLDVIPGVELSAEKGLNEMHILGYYVDHYNDGLRHKLEILRKARRERAWRMMEKLAGLGMRLHWERIVQIAGEGSAFGRPHVAQALQEKGYVSSIDEAFDRYIGRRGPAYVSRYKITPLEAIKMITDAKGLPVLAHPRGQEHMLPELVEAGLVGLEVYYPGYAIDQSEALVELAKRHTLIPTGGTDFHGRRGLGTMSVGQVWVPMQSVERLHVLAMNQADQDSTVL